MRTLMDKINHFESLKSQTVKDFNQVFEFAKLRDVPDHLEVTIGELANSSTSRFLTVGSLIVRHDFSRFSVSELEEYKKEQEKDNSDD